MEPLDSQDHLESGESEDHKDKAEPWDRQERRYISQLPHSGLWCKIKNGLYRIVWRCSYCSITETDANIYWILYTLNLVSVSVLGSGSVNEP